MNTHIRPLLSFSNHLPAPATIALLVASALLLEPLAMATGQSTKKQASAHTSIILQHHPHGRASGGTHSDIILQHHHQGRSSAHSDIILQNHHH